MAQNFSNKTVQPRLDFYSVAIFPNKVRYLYPCLSFNHAQAVDEAIARHLAEGYQLPMGTRCLVCGPCQEVGCACGGEKMRISECFIVPENEDRGATN